MLPATTRSMGRIGCLVLLAMLHGCSFLATSKLEPAPAAAVDYEQFSPAGVWIYEDKLVTGEARLDENGDGSYPWKEGYFVTAGWTDGLWTGTWHQPGNDREGGFEARISEGFDFARGRWWYSRIGSDTAPIRPGGRFTMTRVAP